MYEYKIEQGTCCKIEIADESEENTPQGRILHSMATYQNDIYIYGGESKVGDYLGDLWKFSTSENKWTKIDIHDDGPKPRSGHSIITIGSKIYVFGGKTGNIHETNELWAFDIEKQKFELKHDTLLEQYTDKELQSMSLLAQTEESKKSPKALSKNSF